MKLGAGVAVEVLVEVGVTVAVVVSVAVGVAVDVGVAVADGVGVPVDVEVGVVVDVGVVVAVDVGVVVGVGVGDGRMMSAVMVLAQLELITLTSTPLADPPYKLLLGYDETSKALLLPVPG